MFLSDLPSQVQALTRGSTHTRAYLREGGMAMVGSVEFTKEKYPGVMIGEECLRLTHRVHVRLYFEAGGEGVCKRKDKGSKLDEIHESINL